MSRSIAALAGALALALPATASASDYAGTALNIIPSGQSGAVPAPAGADEQAKMYAGLTPLYDQVTEGDLTKYYKSERLTASDSCPCTTEEVPHKGVTITRDRFGVPHITAKSRDALTWATGWVLEEDRSLLLSIGRYPARLAAIDAPNTNAFSLVTSVKPVVPSKQVERIIGRQTKVLRHTKGGRALLHDIDVYVKGINARLRAEKSKEKPWTRVDIYAINALVGQIFGQGGGDEIRRSELFSGLIDRLGAAKASPLFDDLSEHNDADAPNTTEQRFPYLPIPNRATGNRQIDAGSFKPATSGNDLAKAAAVRTPGPEHMSNFLMVAANRSTNGHPIFVAGPQIGYYYPGLTLEMDLKAPGMQSRGATAPGFPGNILIGRGQDNAWTLTSAGSDNIDHYVETLCGGSTTRYRYKGKCRKMHVVHAGTVAGKQLTYRTTVHGPVVGYATSKGVKVAISRKRSTFGKDILFQLPFRDMTLNRVHDAKQFIHSFEKSPFTFNAGYADDRDIAFYSAGRLPIRAKDVDPRLPTNGNGHHEWRGWLAPAKHAHAINAPDGTLVNWNNRPSAGWGAADDNWEYGSVHRVQMLDAGLARSEKHTPASVVAAMNRAATTDLRVEDVLPVVEQVLRTGPAPSDRDARLLDLIDQWRNAGPGWLDRDGNGKVDNPAAAIVQALYPKVADAVMGPVLGPQLPELKQLVGDNADPDSDFTGGMTGYVVKDLQRLLGQDVKSPFHTRFCGGGDLAACRTALWQAVTATGDELAKAQGNEDPAAWTIDEPIIRFQPLGTPTIPFTNRPSGIQQVLTFTGHRPAQPGAVAAEDVGPEVPDRAAAGPLLGRPVLLDELDRVAGPLVAGEPHEVVEHARPPLAGRQPGPLVVQATADEREEDADAGVGRAVVVRHPREPGVAHALPAEARLAPERRRVDRLDLRQRSRRHRLQHAPLAVRQRRGEGDAGRQHRRHRHDRALRVHHPPAGDHADAVVVLHDAMDRGLEHHARAEGVGDPLGDDRRAADDPALLRAAAGGDQPGERPGRLRVARCGDVLRGVQQRELLGVGAPDGLADGVHDRARLGARHARVEPGPERLAVELAGALGPPWRGDADLLAELVELQRGAQRLEHLVVLGDADRGRVQRPPAPGDERVGALVVDRERLGADRVGEREDPVLRGADELGADLRDRRAADDGGVLDAAAHAVARLEDQHRVPPRAQPAGRRQPGQPGADHHDVDLLGGRAGERGGRPIQSGQGGTGRPALEQAPAGQAGLVGHRRTVPVGTAPMRAPTGGQSSMVRAP
ncbi:MAG TPA: penicillin acylase family protein [Baekduia sp.]|nr:penicillin acylase family protein [Baekduia sp.]